MYDSFRVFIEIWFKIVFYRYFTLFKELYVVYFDKILLCREKIWANFSWFYVTDAACKQKYATFLY